MEPMARPGATSAGNTDSSSGQANLAAYFSVLARSRLAILTRARWRVLALAHLLVLAARRPVRFLDGRLHGRCPGSRGTLGGGPQPDACRVVGLGVLPKKIHE